MKSNVKIFVAVFALFVLCAVPAGAQKFKNKKKEKRFEPVAKANVADYAGRYVGIVPDYYLEITAAGADGQLSVTSYEGRRRATLRGVRVEGARLTATRVYENGATKPFEATFANRILNGESAFGIMVENLNIEFEDMTFNRIFYRLDSNP